MIARSHWQQSEQVHKMAMKSGPEERDSECASVKDLLRLVDEAVTEPANPDCAGHLLTQAEMQRQFPADYVATAQGCVPGLGDPAYARELLNQAKKACFEGSEYAAAGHAFANLLDDRGKGRELLQQATDKTSDTGAMLQMAAMAGATDVVLAKTLTDKMEASCKRLKDLPTVGTDAGRACSGRDPEGISDVSGDRGWAREANDQLQDEFVSDRALFRYSRQYRLNRMLTA